MIHSHCASAAILARQLGLPLAVEEALAFTFERHDGAGLPAGVQGSQIPVHMRVAQVADVCEVHHRTYGLDGVVAMLRSRRGGQFDPDIVDVVLAAPEELLGGAPVRDAWQEAIGQSPDRGVVLDEDSLDSLVRAIGDFVDLKCPFTVGHSRGAASLAARTGELMGLDKSTVRVLRRAGHLHDIGRLGVSNQVWSSAEELSSAAWERVRMHPYLTERVLRRTGGLEAERDIARAHHEHLDGSGYPLGLSGAALGRGERILAAAVAYQSATEPRPYREAMSPDGAARRLSRRGDAGHLDPECIEAVLAVTGRRAGVRHGQQRLTPRERQVLAMVARGMSNKQIAHELVLSVKTVRNHVERSYAKIGVSNRVGASLYAVEHGLLAAAAEADPPGSR